MNVEPIAKPAYFITPVNAWQSERDPYVPVVHRKNADRPGRVNNHR
jgi:hypothetical protein